MATSDNTSFPLPIDNAAGGEEDAPQPAVNDTEKGITTSPSYDLQEVKEDRGAIETSSAHDAGVPGYPVPIGDVLCYRKTQDFRHFFWLTWKWLVVNRPQILAGITVALAQVPEAVSFSFVAGVDPIVGLQSAWVMGLMTSLFGGRPGMVAGATGAIAIVLPKIVEKGIGYMFYAIMLAGIIQMIFGFLRLGVLVRMIPHPVMVGFCNGLAIVIFVAQFNIFKVRPEEEAGRLLLEIGGAFGK